MSENFEKLDVVTSIEDLTEEALDELTNGDLEYEVVIDNNEVYEDKISGKDDKIDE